MKKKISYLVFTLTLIIFLLNLKPFVSYNSIDLNIFKNIMKVLSLGLGISLIFSLLTKKSKKVINIFILLISIVVSFSMYQKHTIDYKTNLKLYLNNLISSAENNSVITTSKEENLNELEPNSDDTLRVNYIDVKQGDSIFIELPNKEVMLIDSGEKNQKDKVINYIKNLGYNKIDYVVGTHPHTDHIGALSYIINEFDIGKIYMPKKESNSNTFLNLLKTIKDKGLKVNSARSGTIIKDDNDLKIKIIAPVKEYNNTNNSSAVIKLTYKNNTFLFMGDAEIDSENDITDSVRCDVIKVGHHGSDTSSSVDFVNKTKAKYAIISVGEGNIYNHPYQNIIKRWQDIGAKVYRTDELGDIVISSDGNNISVNKNIKEKSEDSKSSIELIEANVIKGKNSIIKIKALPNTKYSIELYTKSGISKSKDLKELVSDDLGYVTWMWKLSSNTKEGKYKFIIKSENEQKEFEYEIK